MRRRLILLKSSFLKKAKRVERLLSHAPFKGAYKNHVPPSLPTIHYLKKFGLWYAIFPCTRTLGTGTREEGEGSYSFFPMQKEKKRAFCAF